MASVQVRYIVNDVDAAIEFYTKHLGFKLEMHPAPAFAMLSLGALRLVLSEPIRGPAAARPCPTVPSRLRAGGIDSRLKFRTWIAGSRSCAVRECAFGMRL